VCGQVGCRGAGRQEYRELQSNVQAVGRWRQPATTAGMQQQVTGAAEAAAAGAARRSKWGLLTKGRVNKARSDDLADGSRGETNCDESQRPRPHQARPALRHITHPPRQPLGQRLGGAAEGPRGAAPKSCLPARRRTAAAAAAALGLLLYWLRLLPGWAAAAQGGVLSCCCLLRCYNTQRALLLARVCRWLVPPHLLGCYGLLPAAALARGTPEGHAAELAPPVAVAAASPLPCPQHRRQGLWPAQRGSPAMPAAAQAGVGWGAPAMHGHKQAVSHHCKPPL
jgi:hypothetical protein